MDETRAAATDALRVVVFADFVCPYSYLVVDQIDRLARDYDVQPLWRPHWLHPETPPEGSPKAQTTEAAAKRERQLAWIKEMSPEHHDRIRIPAKRHYSFHAFEAMEFAYDQGMDFQFKTALYALMWEQERDIGDPDTLCAAADQIGLDAGELKVALDERHYAARALEAVEQARRIGITSTPTIFLGRTRINGWHYYEVLQQVMEKETAKARATLVS